MHKFLGEQRLLLNNADHRGFLDPRDRALRNGRGRRQPQRLPDQASLSEKVPRSEHSDDGLFSLPGSHQNLDLAALDVKNRIGRLALRKDNRVLFIMRNGSIAIEGGEKHLRVEFGFSLGHRRSGCRKLCRAPS